MNKWDRQWFGPVAAIRPYLFQKCFMLMIAMDLLVLMVERGARYGVDRFNVAHFRWLDSIHRMLWESGVPSANFYVCVLVLTSFFAFILFVIGHRGWLMLLVTVLYTYAWSMSRLDSYLHHYMITLIMSCMIFFPFIDPRQIRDELTATPTVERVAKKNRRKNTAEQKSANGGLGLLAGMLFCLAVGYRLLLSRPVGLTANGRWGAMFVCAAIVVAIVFYYQRKLQTGGPLVSAWAFRLLGTTVGVIYVFTSIAKMDAEWCGGHTLQQVGTTADVLSPVERFATMVGVSPGSFWAVLATFVIPLELVLAGSYLVAVWQDEPNRIWLPRWCMFAWLLAVGLHLNNEMMNLVIQWFGYYMLFLATLFLLPSRVLLTLGSVFVLPDAWWRERYEQRVAALSNGQAMVLLGLVSFAALLCIVFAGFFTLIVGAMVASCVLAAGLVLVLIIGMVQGLERRSLTISGSATVAALLMVATVAQCSMRFDYYYLRGKSFLLMGKQAQAAEVLEQATAFTPPSLTAADDLYMDLGASYRRLGNAKQSAKNYRKGLELNPTNALLHYNLGFLLHDQNELKQAEHHYRQAVALKSDLSDAWLNLGNILDFTGRSDEALQCLEAALAVEPDAVDIQESLAKLKAKIDGNPLQD